MTEIGNSGIYCIDTHLQYALSAHEVTHIARRLIEGVFTKEAITKSTFTGQSARAQGKTRQLMPVVALNDYAKNAIIGTILWFLFLLYIAFSFKYRHTQNYKDFFLQISQS